jgi:hypothetical protein
LLQKCAPKWQPECFEFGFECSSKCGYLGAQAINFAVCAQIKNWDTYKCIIWVTELGKNVKLYILEILSWWGGDGAAIFQDLITRLSGGEH